MKGSLRGIDPVVFWGSAVVIAVFVVWGLAAPENLGTLMSGGLSWIITNFGWAFVLIATGALLLWACGQADDAGFVALTRAGLDLALAAALADEDARTARLAAASSATCGPAARTP